MRWNRRSSGIRAEGDSSSDYFMNYYDALNYIIEEKEIKEHILIFENSKVLIANMKDG